MSRFLKKYFENFLFFYRFLKHRIFIQVALSICVGLLDGFGLTMFLPLLQMADGSGNHQAEDMGNLGFLVTLIESLTGEITLLSVLVVLAVFFILKGCALYIDGINKVSNQQFFIKKVRVSLIESLRDFEFGAFVNSDVGRIQNTLTGDVGRIGQAYQHYFFSFQNLVLVIVYISFAILIDFRFSLLITVGGLLTNFIYRSITVRTKSASQKVTQRTNTYQGLVIQYVANFKYLKSTGMIGRYTNRVIEEVGHIEENNRKIGHYGAIIKATREPLLIIIVCAVILVHINLLDGVLSAILISLLFFYRSLNALVSLQNSQNSFLAVSGSLQNHLDFRKDLDSHKESYGKQSFEGFRRSLELRNASFSYGDLRVLNDVNLTVEKNQTIAFVGESGSGKTTIVNVLVGLLKLQAGQLLIDGRDSEEIDMRDFQKRIGYITQEPVIFNDTLFNNVTLWAEPSKENKRRFESAIEQASLSEFVRNLSDGEQTLLGNNGINLSGGQRQRISIARELYKDIDILVLDEATSALDSETEKAVQKSIEELQGRYTVIVVAHRLSTIKNADHIYFMDQGRITSTGTFEHLTKTSEKFRRMVELQDV